MSYELYIDAFFLLNFFTDTLLLLLLRKLLKCTATHLRIFLGGLFGAVAACILLLLPGIPAWGKLFAGYGAVSIAMIKISFCRMRWKQLLHAAVCLYALAFFTAGGILLLTARIPALQEKAGMQTVCAGFLLLYGMISFLERYKRKKGKFVKVSLFWHEKEIALKALIDTGNSLFEPITGKPVSIVEQSVLLEALGKIPAKGLLVIPYHSIGKRSGILPGYEMTKLIIFGENETIEIEKPMVGLFDGRLSTASAYRMILHPTLTKNQEEEI